jgi:hypothetical protein
MSSRVPIVCTALLVGFLLASKAAFAQEEAFSQRFDSVLSQHGIVGGGVAIVHVPEPTTQLFFGEYPALVYGANCPQNWALALGGGTAMAML